MKPRVLLITAALAFCLSPFGAHADTIYVANNYSSTVMQFTSAGAGSVFANTAVGPHGLAFASDGSLYVAIPNNNTITKFSSTGTALGVFATLGSSGPNGPTGLAFDTAGNLYAADANDNTIKKFTPAGVGSIFANTSLSYPTGLAFDIAGNLYAANGNGNNIVRYASTGTYLGVFAGSGGASPVQLAFDSTGNLYVANNGGGGIVKITPGGVGSVFANPGPTPLGLAFDSAGDLYASYNTDNVIKKYSATGTDLGVFANTGLSNPSYLAIQVPEPASGVLILGLGGMLLLRRRRVSAL